MNPLACRLALPLMIALAAQSAAQTVALRGKTVYTMGAAGKIDDGVVLIRDGRIVAVGPAAGVTIPAGVKTLAANVVTPGLIDAHSTVGLTGYLNYGHDQDQLEHSAPMQPELRVIDAYNPQERLIEWIRGFGVTTIHTGHAPGELISGQTAIVKTIGNTISEAVVVETAALAATLSPLAFKDGKQAPGTRGKMMALLRAELLRAQDYLKKREGTDEEKRPARDLRLETLGRALAGELPLMITAHRAQDIDSVLRLAAEFKLRVWLDGAAESYLRIEQIKSAGVPVIVHPTMTRAFGETANLSMETASKLHQAGIPVALQSGYESYVPKTRVVLFEAGIAAAYGLGFDAALASITIDAAKLLGIDKRVGSLEVGKDGDAALYDGDPFEYTSHCVATVIGGVVASEAKR